MSELSFDCVGARAERYAVAPTIVFLPGETGFSVEQVPWDKEATYRLPVATWREAMDAIFPDAAWIRLRRDNLDALARFKSRLALPTWDDALEALLAERVTDE